MNGIIRPTKTNTLSEQKICPVCGADYINQNVIIPYEDMLLAVYIYECANQHSWEKYPGGIPPRPVKPEGPSAFQDVYRPLYDTQEPVKRLFR